MPPEDGGVEGLEEDEEGEEDGDIELDPFFESSPQAASVNAAAAAISRDLVIPIP